MFGSIIQGIAGIQDSNINIWNAYQSWKNYNYQRHLQNRVFRREDTTHQRAVKDLMAAGLSPTLAAGSGSPSGAIVTTSAPHAESNMSELAMNMLAIQKMESDITKTKAESEYIEQQKSKSKTDQYGSQIENQIKNLKKKIKENEAKIKTETQVPGDSFSVKYSMTHMALLTELIL